MLDSPVSPCHTSQMDFETENVFRLTYALDALLRSGAGS